MSNDSPPMTTCMSLFGSLFKRMQQRFSPHDNFLKSKSSLDVVAVAYMQCPAVSTQQLSMRTPPHTCRKIWLVFLCLTCTDTCQGMPPGLTFRPPKIRVIGFLGCGFPQVENRGDGAGAGAGGAGLGFRVGGGLVVTGLGAGAGDGTGFSIVGLGSGGEGVVETSSSSSSKSENTHKRTLQRMLHKL